MNPAFSISGSRDCGWRRSVYNARWEVYSEEIDSMNQVITATIEDGMLKPDQEIAFAAGTKVRVTIELCDNELGHISRACC